MAQVLKTQARIERSTLLSEDAIVNTFHFMVPTDGNAAAVTAATAIHSALATFYTGIDIYLANTLAPLVTFKTYTLTDPQPRVPVLTSTAALTLGATALPGELALCLSYRAQAVSGVPVARTRGRIFIGPLTQVALGSASGGDLRPNLAVNTGLRDNAKILADALEGTYPWAVWSPTDLTARAVREVSTDDAFDIQRRRGSDPTARVTLATS